MADDTSQEDTDQADGFVARAFVSDVHPGARFSVVSEPLDYAPKREYQPGEQFLADLYWNQFETRVVRYGNTRERVLLFPRKDADVAQGDRYVLDAVTATDLRLPELVRVRFVRTPAGDGTTSERRNASESGLGAVSRSR